MRILIADTLAPEAAAYLGGQPDTEVTTLTGLSGDLLADALREHDGVVIRSAVQVTGPVLERCADSDGWRLRAIARAGVGVDNIDLETATRLGIAVMNTASASTITTAEHAFALMISLARNIFFQQFFSVHVTPFLVLWCCLACPAPDEEAERQDTG